MKCVKAEFQSPGLQNCSISRSPKDGGHASKNICGVMAKTVKKPKELQNKHAENLWVILLERFHTTGV